MIFLTKEPTHLPHKVIRKIDSEGIGLGNFVKGEIHIFLNILVMNFNILVPVVLSLSVMQSQRVHQLVLDDTEEINRKSCGWGMT